MFFFLGSPLREWFSWLVESVLNKQAEVDIPFQHDIFLPLNRFHNESNYFDCSEIQLDVNFK